MAESKNKTKNATVKEFIKKIGVNKLLHILSISLSCLAIIMSIVAIAKTNNHRPPFEFNGFMKKDKIENNQSFNKNSNKNFEKRFGKYFDKNKSDDFDKNSTDKKPLERNGRDFNFDNNDNTKSRKNNPKIKRNSQPNDTNGNSNDINNMMPNNRPNVY